MHKPFSCHSFISFQVQLQLVQSANMRERPFVYDPVPLELVPLLQLPLQ